MEIFSQIIQWIHKQHFKILPHYLFPFCSLGRLCRLHLNIKTGSLQVRIILFSLQGNKTPPTLFLGSTYWCSCRRCWLFGKEWLQKQHINILNIFQRIQRNKIQWSWVTINLLDIFPDIYRTPLWYFHISPLCL